MLDLLIRGGAVIDGSGTPARRADVGVEGGRIVAVEPLPGAAAARVVEAGGLVVCPGFIDIHAHSDLQLLAHPEHDPKVRQGVTLDVIGQDGLSYAPVDDEVLGHMRAQLVGWNGDPPEIDWGWRSVGEYLDRFDRGVAINVCYLLPHGTIRMCAMGSDERAPTDAELDHMRRLVREGLRDGAVGLSAGLTYAPGMYADDAEMVALCSEMRGTGAFYCPHHRNYGMTAIEGYRDCIEIARAAGVPLHLAHAHLGFEVNRGRAHELLEMLDAARAAGADITLDTYPYLAGATYLHAYLPGWVQSGGTQATLDRLADSSMRARIRRDMEEVGSDGFHDVPIDWRIIVVSSAALEHNRRWIGRSIADGAAETGKAPIDFYCDLLVEERLGCASISHIGNEENVRAIMQDPWHTAGSDGILVGDRPHPRGWGTFPRYLAEYVRELGVLRLEQAVRKMTSLPAWRLGLTDRGLVREGMAADLVCLDPERVADTATYDEPRRYPVGIHHVAVNGRLVIDDGAHTGELPGRALRRPR